MKSAAPELLIHATNVTGLGAAHVVTALLETICPRLKEPTCVCLPATGELSKFKTPNDAVSVRRFRRHLPHQLSRFIESSAPALFFPAAERTLVLGDIPLANRPEQIVFLQQPHVISPDVNANVDQSARFRVSRMLFRRRLPYVRAVVVQSEMMQQAIERSYPAAVGKTVVISHPSPLLPPKNRRPQRPAAERLLLFYPGAGYPHKNHALLERMDALRQSTTAPAVELRVTLNPKEATLLRDVQWVKNLARLAPHDCIREYETADALFFPSLLESYGLPLIEAMTLGLPIVCADLPYARWLCGSEAIYFDPTDPADAWRAVSDLSRRRAERWQPDWREALSKLTPDWNSVAENFLVLLRTG